MGPIRGLTQLSYLDLTTNQITDLGAVHLLELKKLTHLYLMSNQVTDQTVYKMFQTLNALEVLDVRFNIQDPPTKDALKANRPGTLQLFC